MYNNPEQVHFKWNMPKRTAEQVEPEVAKHLCLQRWKGRHRMLHVAEADVYEGCGAE